MKRCLDFHKTDEGNLKVTLTEEGWVEIKDLLERYGSDHIRIMYELMEYQLCNGWQNIQPDTIGAMTDSEWILTEDAEQDDNGNYVSVGRVYWDDSYMIRSPVIELLTNGEWVLRGVE